MVLVGTTSSRHESRRNNPTFNTKNFPINTFFRGKGNIDFPGGGLHRYPKCGM